MDWFTYVLAATLIYGVINFLYKVGAENGFQSLHLVNIQSVTVTLIAGIIMISRGNTPQDIRALLFFAALNSFFWAGGTSLKISAMKHIPANIAMPLNKLNSVFVIMIGLLFFGDSPSPKQYCGIALSTLTLFLLAKNNGVSGEEKSKSRRKGIIYILIAAVAIALSMTVGKLAAMKVEKIPYIFFSYAMASAFTFIGRKYIMRPPKTASSKSKLTALGIAIGILNIAGYYLMLKAWSTGPISLVQGILSQTMVITLILSSIVYKEKFTIKITAALILSIIASLLIKG
ncbi:DMT family transporter [bacterium]|nr:DMT family transporter [bacterium]